jgi:membrane protein
VAVPSVREPATLEEPKTTGTGRVAAVRASLGGWFGHVVRAVTAAVKAYSEHFGPQIAAAISYHVLFSLFPLAIIVIAAIGLVLQDDERRETFTDWVLDRVPLADEAGVDLAAAIDGLAGPLSVAGLIAIVGLLWSASGMMAAIRRGLDAAFSDSRRPAVQGKLVDFLLVLATGLVLLAAVALAIVARLLERLEAIVAGPDVVSEMLRVVQPLVLVFAAVLCLYRYLPVEKPRFRDVWLGALLAALATVAINVGFSFYLSHFADYNVVYGSIGAALAFLVVVYLTASAFLIGAEFSAAWPRTREPPPRRPAEETGSLGGRVLGFLKGLVVRDRKPPD